MKRSLLELRRRLLLRRSSGALHHYLSCPLPDLRQDYRETDFLALDLETTGLNPKEHCILSVGFVPITGGRIRLEGARHLLIRTGAAIGQSATIHGIFDDEAEADGVSLEEALEVTLEALRGRVLIAHYARIERSFLGNACRRCYRLPLLMLTTDTLRLEQRRLGYEEQLTEGTLRLHAVRSRYNLPRYGAHNALTDALAAAELFLALASNMAGSGTLPLARLV